MKECIDEFFIEDNTVKKSHDFPQEVLTSGKAVYEVIRIIDGIPLFLEAHLERMSNSVRLINRELLLDISEIERKILEISLVNKKSEGNIKMVFIYGESEDKSLMYFINHNYPAGNEYEEGVDAVLFHGERENPNAKIINMNFRNIVEKEIKEKGAYEAILVDNSGYITEGSKSNIFMVRKQEIVTAPLDLVLPGVTRKVILLLLGELGITVVEEKVQYSKLEEFDGIFLTGTSPKVLPISRVDNLNFQSPQNQVIKKIMNSYNEKICNYLQKKKI